MTKEDIIELCHKTEMLLRSNGQFHEIRFVNGLKPCNYWLPDIKLTSPASGDEYPPDPLAWFAEIFVDGECIFRESYIPKVNEDPRIVEGMLITRLAVSVFTYGLMSSRDDIKTLARNKIMLDRVGMLKSGKNLAPWKRRRSE